MQANAFDPSSSQPPNENVNSINEPSLGDLITAMAHLYRADVQRANVWRQRLDATTNWAVITTGASISIVFGSATAHHGLLILNNMLVTAFLIMEAYRFRYYQVWSSRTHALEVNFFAPLLSPPGSTPPDWKAQIVQDLLSPHFTISFREAFLRRLGRSYIWIYLLLFFAWSMKLALFPESARSLAEVVSRAAIYVVPGVAVVSLYLFVLLGLLVAFFSTLRSYGMLNETLHQTVSPSKPGGDPEPPQEPA